MFKNIASQKLTVFAFDSTTNLPKSGDAANITAYYDLDDAGVTVLTDTSATEKDATNAKGFYIFDLAQAETNGNKILFSAKSSTANIVVVAVPAIVYTLPANFTAFSIDSGGVAKANLAQILGTALTETAGQIAAAFKKFFNIATPASTMDALTLVTTATNLTNAPAAGDFTAAMKTSLNAATPTGGDTAGTTTLLARLTSTRAGLLDNLDAAISSRSTYAGGDTAGVTTLLARLTATRAGLLDNLDAAISSRSTYAGADTSGTVTLLARVSSTRAALMDNLAGIDVLVSSRLASGSYTAPDNSSISAIKAVTDVLPDGGLLTSIAQASDLDAKIPANLVMTAGKVWALNDNGDPIPTAVDNADTLLDRNMATGTDSGGRTVRNALRFLRNKFSTSAGVLTVTKEDDTTTAWTSTLTTDNAAEPVTGSDPS